MIFPDVAEDYQVVKVGGKEDSEWLKQVVHETLEGCLGTLSLQQSQVAMVQSHHHH